MTSKAICAEKLSAESSANAQSFETKLLVGETTQGFVTARYLPHRQQTDSLSRLNLSPLALRTIMCVLNVLLKAGYLTSLTTENPAHFALAMTWTMTPSR